MLRSSNVDGDTFSRQQASYISKMETWKGASVSSSEFVTHFVAGCANATNFERELQNREREFDLTVEEAITSVLPNPISSTRSHSNGTIYSEEEWKEWLMGKEKSSIVQACEPRFRHDPSVFPVDTVQLSPTDLLALGCIWFLPVTAPGDPALGQKVRTRTVSCFDFKAVIQLCHHCEASSIGT